VAAAQGDLAAVDLFLAAGADPDEITRIDDYETALEVAERAGRDEVVARLAPLTTRPAWERAAEAGAVAELARLAAAGHDVDARDGYGQTALMRAAHAGRVEAVKWLVAHGADLDHTAKFGLSALMLAVVGGHQQVARVLVSAGADVTKRGTGAPQFEGRTAADLADARGEPRLARLIREPGRR
jgi:ankyrin repeat protein